MQRDERRAAPHSCSFSALSAFDCNEYREAMVTVSVPSRSHGLFRPSKSSCVYALLQINVRQDHAERDAFLAVPSIQFVSVQFFSFDAI